MFSPTGAARIALDSRSISSHKQGDLRNKCNSGVCRKPTKITEDCLGDEGMKTKKKERDDKERINKKMKKASTKSTDEKCLSILELELMQHGIHPCR